MKLLAALLVATTAACANETSDGQEAPGEGRAQVDVDTDTAKPDYSSTYSSNCFCLSCTVYCSVNGKTEKAGTCC